MSSPAATTVTLKDGGVLVLAKVIYVSPVILKEFRYEFEIVCSGNVITAQFTNDEDGKAFAYADRQSILDCI